MKRVSPTGARGCEAADGRSDRRNAAFRAPAGAANPHAAPPAAISALRVAVGRGALRGSADGRDLERHQRPVPSLAGLRRPPATAPRPTRSHRRRRLDPGAARLLPLPAHPFETDLVRAVRSGKTPLGPLRPQRVLDSPHPRPQAAHPRGRRHLRPHHRGPRAPRRAPRRHPPGQRTHHPRPPSRRRPRLRHASIASPNVASRYARTPPGSSPSSTTTGRRNSPPPSNATPSAPASSPTSSRPDVGRCPSTTPDDDPGD